MTGKRVAWALCAAWMGLIFLMSAIPGDLSSRESGFFVDLLLCLLSFCFGERASAIDPDFLHLLVRKAAHIAEYFVLFLLYRRALRLSGVAHPGILALLLCALYAVTDEFHQSFVDDRGPSPADVCIDTAGAALSWVCAGVCDLVLKRTHKRSKA